MDGEGYLPVKLPAKPGGRPLLTDAERDELEHHISCPCPCTLDVFTCRTSMPCGFSPALHRDIMGLVEGGYSAQEIIDAFVGTYGEQILMQPEKQGFNWAGYLMPFAVIGAGGAGILSLLRRWHRAATPQQGTTPLPVEATPDELARLEAELRRDG
jgi:cytochrome c-type biogenesis protein CcmH